jgi:methionine-S-sulfoxide reductase
MVIMMGVNASEGANLEKATFAGGCFWCMQPPYDKLPGVVSTVVGYTGGHVDNPTYEQVSSGQTGQAEAVEITFEPAKTSYEQLLEVFWHNVDPTALNRQFADVGTQYRTAIFYQNEAQKKAAEASKAKLAQLGKFKQAIATAILPATKFWPAEDYHQGYYRKSAGHYKLYRAGSGREQYLKQTWGAEVK